MITAMSRGDGVAWFGKAPPDLSVIARVRGSDWIYTYLKSFYLDESPPVGWNNTLFPNASMPNPLWELQGLQRAGAWQEDRDRRTAGRGARSGGQAGTAGARRTSTRPCATSPPSWKYAGEPAALKRVQAGVWVILFLVFFTFLAWLLKKEYWKDVH
jgi:ubiquinol-cytochrome c reductase cytochrome c1 subunit